MGTGSRTAKLRSAQMMETGPALKAALEEPGWKMHQDRESLSRSVLKREFQVPGVWVVAEVAPGRRGQMEQVLSLLDRAE